jgi:hypothetical protein
MTVEQRKAGEYAENRYRKGLQSYRRRIRRRLLAFAVPTVVGATGLAIWFDTEFWWWMAGLFTGGMLAVVRWAIDLPPEHVAKWGRGAEGERWTAKELKALEREGWRIEHDRQKGGYNLDHIAIGPVGRFLIESKTSTGDVSIEDGVYTVRFADDPEEIYVNRLLHGRMKGRARELWQDLRSEGAGRTWVHPVVVIWGSFPDQLVHYDKVTYVHGFRLVEFLHDPGAVENQVAS